MKKVFVAVIIFTGLSCKKEPTTDTGTKTPTDPVRCGILLSTPVLDSFVPPTYYITANVAFPDGDEIVHFHGNVTGDHDGSWFLPRYAKDSSYCTTP